MPGCSLGGPVQDEFRLRFIMNLVLISPEDLARGSVQLEGERAEHVRCVHRAKEGDSIRVGVVDGHMGEGIVVSIERRKVRIDLKEPLRLVAPAPHPVALAVAMCRPPTLRKVLSYGASMGVKRFLFFHSRRVEKSFWQSHQLADQEIRAALVLGLEQARDTVMPSVEFFPRFRPFAEDILREISTKMPVRVLDPQGQRGPLPQEAAQTLVLGPEGGFVDFERDLFGSLGFDLFDLGPRILRVEVASIAVLQATSRWSG